MVLKPFAGLRDLSLRHFERLQLAALPPSVTSLTAQVQSVPPGHGSSCCLAGWLQASGTRALWSAQRCAPPAHPPLQLPTAAAPLPLPPELDELLGGLALHQLLGGAAGLQALLLPLVGPLRPLANVSAGRGVCGRDATGLVCMIACTAGCRHASAPASPCSAMICRRPRTASAS